MLRNPDFDQSNKKDLMIKEPYVLSYFHSDRYCVRKIVYLGEDARSWLAHSHLWQKTDYPQQLRYPSTFASIPEYSLPTTPVVSPAAELPDFGFVDRFHDTSLLIADMLARSFICLSTKVILMAQINLRVLRQLFLVSQLKVSATTKRLLPYRNLTVGGRDHG